MGSIYLFLLYLLLFKLGKSLHSFHPRKRTGVLIYYYFKGTSTKLCKFKSQQRYAVKEGSASLHLGAYGFHTPQTPALRWEPTRRVSKKSKQIRSIYQYFRHPESGKIPYHTAKPDEQTQQGPSQCETPSPSHASCRKVLPAREKFNLL